MFVVSLLLSAAAPGANLDVCPTCAYSTVAAAVSAAGNGDSIRIAPGVYAECLSLPDKSNVVFEPRSAGDVTIQCDFSAAFTTSSNKNWILRDLNIIGRTYGIKADNGEVELDGVFVDSEQRGVWAHDAVIIDSEVRGGSDWGLATDRHLDVTGSVFHSGSAWALWADNQANGNVDISDAVITGQNGLQFSSQAGTAADIDVDVTGLGVSFSGSNHKPTLTGL